MRPEIYSWNGTTSINDGSNYRTSIKRGQLALLSANAVSVPRANLFPFFSTAVLNTRVLVIGVDILPGNNLNTFRENLKGIFDITDPVHRNLIIKDKDDSDKQWYVSGRVVNFVEDNGSPLSFSISIFMDEPVWKLVTAATNTWNITASGQTNVVTNGGNQKVASSFAITPTSARTGGLSYRRWVPIYNKLNTPFTFVLDITNGGLDTATLTTTKMQADGDDFRVWMDGQEQNRWLSAMDTANTLCHSLISLAPKQEATLLSNLSGSGTTATVSLTQTNASKSFLQEMYKQDNFTFLIESEALTGTAANINFGTFQITSMKRAQKNTSIAAHTAPLTVRWIEHDIWILYGDSTLTAPDVDDTKKPIFDVSSTNTSLTFTNYFDSTTSRPGAWQGEVNASKTGTSYTFTANENEFTNPSTELGLAMRNPSATTPTAQEIAQLAWTFYHPAGVTDVTYSGSRYFSNSTFPAVCALQFLQPDAVWITANNTAAPDSPYTWQDFGPLSIDLGGTYNTIRFSLDGSLSTTADEAAMVQFDTLILTIDSSNLPTIGLAAEQAINFLDFTLTNNTTSEYLTCKTPCPTNDTLTIDCDNKSISLSNGERVGTLSFSTERFTWLDMNTGSNTFQFDETGTGNVTIVTTHRDRLM